MTIFKDCKKAIINGEKKQATQLANQAIKEQVDLDEIVEAFSEAIREAGDMFEDGDFFLPELMRSAEAMKAAMKVLTPALTSKKVAKKTLGAAVIGTIEGDIHDIGKTLVASMLSAEGFEVYDLGADVKVEDFIAKAEEVSAKLICISALLTTTMVGQKKLIDTLVERKIREKYKVIIGGAPVTSNWVKEIGADGTASNAVAAVKLAKKLVS